MLKYNGNIIPNDIQIGQMNDLMGCLEFIEKIYYANITLSAHDKKPIVINDEKLVAQIKIIKESNQTNEEKNNLIDKTLRESGHLDINYQRRLFNSILLDFCLWMENSLKMIQEFKPQLAFALARKPLIDEIYYLQLLYLDPQCAVHRLYPENSRVIFKQIPFQLFYKTYLDNVYIQNREYYDGLLLKNGLDWFAEFVYQLRNALFHEIIDPLDEEWQLIYKNAYLLLKEVVDYTTNYSILKEVKNFIETTYIEVENKEFDEEIVTSTESEAFVLNDYELIDDDIEITHIEVEGVDLIDNSACLINKQKAKFKCIVNLSIDGRAKVFDYNQSMYDKEDDKYYFIVHNEVEFRNASAKIEIEAEMGYDLRNIANTANVIKINVKDRMIIVNLSDDESDTNWESVYPFEENNC